jgi:hypothetical protein
LSREILRLFLRVLASVSVDCVGLEELTKSEPPNDIVTLAPSHEPSKTDSSRQRHLEQRIFRGLLAMDDSPSFDARLSRLRLSALGFSFFKRCSSKKTPRRINASAKVSRRMKVNHPLQAGLGTNGLGCCSSLIFSRRWTSAEISSVPSDVDVNCPSCSVRGRKRESLASNEGESSIASRPRNKRLRLENGHKRDTRKK